MNPDYARAYRRLYDEHWWWRAREEFLLGRLRKLFRPGSRIGPILDVGCGDRLFFDELSAFGEPEGVEPDAALLTPQGGSKGPVHVGPFDATYDPGKRFALILLLDVLEHAQDDVAVLRRALELLAPAGRIVITVPALPALWTHHDEINRHHRRYTARSLHALAVAAGLELETSQYFLAWTVPLKLLLRLVQAGGGRARSIPSIPPRWLNQACWGLSRLDLATLGRLELPIGSSLFAAGRVRSA